jgi:hypothetical protein
MLVVSEIMQQRINENAHVAPTKPNTRNATIADRAV